MRIKKIKNGKIYAWINLQLQNSIKTVVSLLTLLICINAISFVLNIFSLFTFQIWKYAAFFTYLVSTSYISKFSRQSISVFIFNGPSVLNVAKIQYSIYDYTNAFWGWKVGTAIFVFSAIYTSKWQQNFDQESKRSKRFQARAVQLNWKIHRLHSLQTPSA